ncbi:MAG: hypothetical protein EG822_11660 [Deltaproteobacteria bacterium]|nr:hypothetical protein [Deltaproteobacteria bacterium]TLN04171.1 MAG: hypothetical protein FDZ73_04650 [bacterium]
MSPNQRLSTARTLTVAPKPGKSPLQQALCALEIVDEYGRVNLENLPFAPNDTTVGTETELQVAVYGSRFDVDLPRTIESSNYFANAIRRAATGDLPRKRVTDIERYLSENRDEVWENSWVRFGRNVLCTYANQVLESDLRADKSSPDSANRTDSGRFLFNDSDGRPMVRIPVSYLVKLAMAQYLGSRMNLPFLLRATAERLMGHYLNDNTSPETFSFHVIPLRKKTGMGLAVARETSKRMLLTQLLVMYANRSFGLKESGQTASVYLAPNPPQRQKALNEHISDSFYRDLFMSPCLSGWDQGEEKYRYMRLCHKVLSRSQLNAVAKLKHAGIILNNLVVLPNTSNVSLANNGTHVSLGSKRLTAAMAAGTKVYGEAQEKYLGDLVIKITEHFLPLFVGTYSAAPYRLDYSAFHPEKALGFLAHELDYSQLRILWRMWKAKAKIRICGAPVTPFGPEWLDRLISRVFNLKGDFVHDFRLLDYLVCLLSTNQSPALDGTLGSSERLKSDLAELGVFDPGMSLYLPIKLREFSRIGFSGFESRQYSLFESLRHDMAQAVNLQNLIHACAYRMIAAGKIRHDDIPDTPHCESERRQIFFGDAIGLSSFYVRKNTDNRFLRQILRKIPSPRPSARYPEYQKVSSNAYRRALLQTLREEAGELVEMLGCEETLRDLQARLDEPGLTASGKLTEGILATIGTRNPLAVRAEEFNAAAEQYYRTDLCRAQMSEAFEFLEEDYASATGWKEGEKTVLATEFGEKDPVSFLRECRDEVLTDSATPETLTRLIGLVILSIHHDTVEAGAEHA